MFSFGASGFMGCLAFPSSTPLEIYKVSLLHFIIVSFKFYFFTFDPLFKSLVFYTACGKKSIILMDG